MAIKVKWSTWATQTDQRDRLAA